MLVAVALWFSAVGFGVGLTYGLILSERADRRRSTYPPYECGAVDHEPISVLTDASWN